jgi:AraC family transcriptional regulator
MWTGYGRRMAQLCGANEAPTVIARTLRKAEMSATRLIVAAPSAEKTPPIAIEDAFVAAVTFQNGYTRQNWLDDRALPSEGPQPAGSISLMDLRRKNETRFKSPIRSVQFHFPRATLNHVAEANHFAQVRDLTTPISVLRPDPILSQLAAALLPVFDSSESFSQLFLEHLLTAAALHVMTAHAEARPSDAPHRGGLAGWQQRRIRELADAQSDADLSLAEMATACRLSPSHFLRAFSASFGITPHRWVVLQRIERAKILLLETSLSLDEIATRTGFASQSHFTRVFAQATACSPGAWRRMRRS